MLFQGRLDRAMQLQQEKGGASGKEEQELSSHIEPVPEEKLPFREFCLMVLSAWGILIPVCLVVLLGIVLVARVFFRV